jgi:hypothetical protein
MAISPLNAGRYIKTADLRQVQVPHFLPVSVSRGPESDPRPSVNFAKPPLFHVLRNFALAGISGTFP